VHTTKLGMEMEVQLHSNLTLEVDRGDWSASYSGRLTVGETASWSVWTGGCV